jgi:hypothetical protein
MGVPVLTLEPDHWRCIIHERAVGQRRQHGTVRLRICIGLPEGRLRCPLAGAAWKSVHVKERVLQSMGSRELRG